MTNKPWPDFLIVGAQKCGTTTLFRDIAKHDGVHLPAEKEPEIFTTLDDPKLIEEAYTALFSRAQEGQLRGEASTGYTKRPENDGIAEKARACIGEHCKILYITRDPVERVVSNYLHKYEHRLMPEPFGEALLKYPELIDYSRYDWQIEPWEKAFGKENVLRLDLATYSANRQEEASKAIRFLGLDPAGLAEIDPGSRANTRNEVKAIHNPLLNSIVGSRLYRERIKPMLSAELREKIRRTLFAPPKLPSPTVTDEQRAYIAAELARTPK